MCGDTETVRAIENEPEITAAGVHKGRHPYMSPRLHGK